MWSMVGGWGGDIGTIRDLLFLEIVNQTPAKIEFLIPLILNRKKNLNIFFFPFGITE